MNASSKKHNGKDRLNPLKQLCIFASLLFFLQPLAALGKPFKIVEKGLPGVQFQIFLSVGNIKISKPDGTPWTITAGANGIASMDFTESFPFKGSDGSSGIMSPNVITDFEQFVIINGVSVPGGGGSVTRIDQATASLEGAFLGTNPTFVYLPLADNLPVVPGFIPAPDFVSDLNGDSTVTADENIYTAVNLSVWESFATSFPLGTTFQVTNGVSSELPGYYFSLTPDITLDPLLGYTSASPLNATILDIGQHQLSQVPEPKTLFLVGIGLVNLLGYRYSRRWKSLAQV